VPRAVDTAAEARRWGGSVHVVTTVGERAFDALADDVLELPAVPSELSALLSVLPAQVVGHHLAVAQFAAAEAAPATGAPGA
jgi:glucosamine--fructose-6-phosphate aminotransferase (isomerizing)